MELHTFMLDHTLDVPSPGSALPKERRLKKHLLLGDTVEVALMLEEVLLLESIHTKNDLHKFP